MSIVLNIKNITKIYGKLTAVNGLNLQIGKGQIFGLLGPNGSGKTTTLGIVLGITNANAGTYEWFEGKYGDDARFLIGALFETPNFYPYMNAEQNLEIIAHIKKIKYDNYDELLTLVNLAHRKETPFSAYSLGMKQRLAIAAALVGDPEVLIFDEPTNGLDPLGIAEVRETILKIASTGKTIIMASHILDEVEKVCTHVAIIKNGNLLAEGPVGAILSNEMSVEIGAQNDAELLDWLKSASFVTKIMDKNGHITVALKENFSTSDLNKAAFERGIVLNHLIEKKKRLEEEFLEIIK